MNRFLLLLTLIILLLLAVNAQAMSSPSYKLEWFVPLTGGGGAAASINYAADFTIGQTVIGASAGAVYKVELGFWAGMVQPPIYLPLINRNYQHAGMLLRKPPEGEGGNPECVGLVTI